jgi:hypothetical protein
MLGFEAIGERCLRVLSAFVVGMDQGACGVAAVLRPRALSRELDRGVLGAYGWTDLAVARFCRVEVEVEVFAGGGRAVGAAKGGGMGGKRGLPGDDGESA